MNVHDTIGELLFIGIVAEKGRCYSSLKKFGYRKLIRKHIGILNKLQLCLRSSDLDASSDIVKKFMDLCKNEPNIGRFYKFTREDYIFTDVGTSYDKIDVLINGLFQDLIQELDKEHIDNEMVHMLLCALHNLPRVYLGKDKETLCNIKQPSITEQEAIRYAATYMTSTMRDKYIVH